MMSGTGALRQFVRKATRLSSRVAFFTSFIPLQAQNNLQIDPATCDDSVLILVRDVGSVQVRRQLLQRRLKFRERQSVEEVLRLFLTEVAGNPIREHTTPVEGCLRPGFLDGTWLSLAFSVTRHCSRPMSTKMDPYFAATCLSPS